MTGAEGQTPFGGESPFSREGLLSRRGEPASQCAKTSGWSRYRGRGDGSGTDRELISACREGKAGVWEALLTKYERLVFSIPLNYGLPRAAPPTSSR